MKKSLKFLLLLVVLCMWCLVLSSASADTSWTDSSMTGTLLSYETTQKALVNALFDDTYQRVNTLFQKSWLALMQSLNYKSLVCLGVMNQNDSMLMAMQKDKQQLKLWFLKDFLLIESDIATLEEKARILREDNISLFEAGTTYESEKANILSKLASVSILHKWLINNFETTYNNKIAKFGQDVIDYSRQNSGVMGYVNDKLFKLEDIDTKFGTLTKQIDQINALLVWSGASFVQSFSGIRASFVTSLDNKLQALINTYVRKYKVLKNLSGVLASEKSFVLRMYGLDFDEKLNTILDQRYDKTDYDFIGTQISTIDTNFRTNNQLSCTKAFTDTQWLDALIATITNKMNTMMVSVNSGLNLAASGGYSDKIKSDLLTQFSTFNNANLLKKLKEFEALIKDKIKILLDEQRASLTVTNTQASTVAAPTVTLQVPSIFTQPLNKNQKWAIVKTLQELLQNNGYYTWPINSINTKQTIEWVYQFQLKNGLLKWYEKKPATRWWMGPATRQKLNELINNGGLTPKTSPIIMEAVQTTGTVITTNSWVVKATTGTTVMTTTGSSTNTNLFYQTMINDLIGSKTTTGDIQAVLQASIATMTNSINNSKTNAQKIFLQGFRSAIQAYLTTLQ